jgi:hypothetical protein
LADRFPRLYEISEEQKCTMEYMKAKNWRLSFRRWLHEELQCQLRRLYDTVYRYGLNADRDRVVWDWEKSGKFSVKSTYKQLCSHECGPSFKNLWKAKIPLKIRIFMWLVFQNVILTKDNLVKRKWKGSPTCYFCKENESSQHLFFECSTAKYVWSLIAFTLGSDCRPCNMDQYWFWIQRSLPQAPSLHVVGLAAVC